MATRTLNGKIELAISLKGISKKFPLYSSDFERLKEALHPLRKTYHSEHWALRDVSIEVPRGETLGIMGRNGAGKSTLLQIITSVVEPTIGNVKVNGRISALLELGAGFNPELTGRDNVLANAPLMGFTRAHMLSLLPEIEAFSDIGEYIDQPVRTYSSGMFVRLAFAMSTSIDPDILIIDEALAVGDASFQEKCFRRLKQFKNQGKTFLIVSHAAGIISQLCDRVAIMEKGRLEFLGPTAQALVHYGQLMFGKTLPEDDLRSLTLAGTSNRPIPPSPDDGLIFDQDGTRCSERPGYNPQERRSGNGAAEITDFKVFSSNLPNTDRILLDAPVRIYLLAHFREPAVKPRLAISIQTPSGLLIHGVNSRMKNLDISAAKRGEKRIFCFRFINRLAPGDYLISLWLMDEGISAPIRLDARESILILHSEGNADFNGLTDLNFEILEGGFDSTH